MTKAEKRDKKRNNKRKMKVSGSSVKMIQKIKVEYPEKYYAK